MNRPIKFRAWDNELKVMRYRWINVVPDSEHAWAWGKDDEDLDGANADTQRFFTDEFLMQFTGLLDKNGKEIYEGDVMQKSYGKAEPLMVGDRKKEPSYKVGFFRGEFLLSAIGRGFSQPLNEHGEYMEVIGNIYENPELLNEQSV